MPGSEDPTISATLTATGGGEARSEGGGHGGAGTPGLARARSREGALSALPAGGGRKYQREMRGEGKGVKRAGPGPWLSALPSKPRGGGPPSNLPLWPS